MQIIYALFIGIFITFIFDFFIFLGMYLYYINFYNIELYFNIFFVDNQNILFFIISTIFYGFFTLFLDNKKIKFLFLFISFLVVLLVLVKDIGHFLGEKIFKQTEVTLQTKKYTFTGDIIYSGRTQIVFFDYDLERNININKKDLIR